MIRRPRPQTRPGSAILYVVLLSPVLILTLAFAVELGALQLKKERLRSALNQAVVVASSSAASGGSTATLDAATASVAVRQSIADNLQPLADMLAGQSPGDIAERAEVHVITAVPAPDPFDSTVMVRVPTVEARVWATVPTGLLSAAGLPATQVLMLTAAAQLRVAGS